MEFKIERDPEYLMHHGILGQKWGQRNGPPYPLDYKDHSAAEKRENPKSVLSGNQREDKKAVKQAFKKARYARAATLTIEDEEKRSQRAYEKGKINKRELDYHKKNSELARDKELKFDKELNKLASDYVSRYGDKSLKSIDKGWDKTTNMTTQKAQRFIYTKGAVPAYLLFGVAGAGVKGAMNIKEFNDYKTGLMD